MGINEKARNQIDHWISGVSYEVSFWTHFVTQKPNRERLRQLQSEKRDLHLFHFTTNELGFTPEKAAQFSVLDVGCGMNYANGDHIDGHPIDFHYVDPLAEFYNSISFKKKLTLPPIEFGFVEYLSSFYNDESISLVIIQNALDHSFDPCKGVIECLRVLKNGGIIYTSHYRNEAQTEHYRGFHQYNIDIQDNRLVCWNEQECIDIQELLGDAAKVSCFEQDGMVIAKIKKIKSLPPSRSRDISFLCGQLMYSISKVVDPAFLRKQRRLMLHQKLMYSVVGKLPHDFKRLLKKLLAKR